MSLGLDGGGVRAVLDPGAAQGGVRPLDLDRMRGGMITDPLADAIRSAYAAASWDVPHLFLCRPQYLTIGLGNLVSAWLNLGLGSTAIQMEPLAQPTYSATGINGSPALVCDGMDVLVAPMFDGTPYSAVVLHAVLRSIGSTLAVPVEHGDVSIPASGSAAIIANDGLPYSWESYLRGSAISRARSAALTPPLASQVITASGDFALASSETEIRIDGVPSTATRPTDGDSPPPVGDQVLAIGARSLSTFGLVGELAAVVMAVGSTSVPLGAVAAVEGLLAAEWNI